MQSLFLASRLTLRSAQYVAMRNMMLVIAEYTINIHCTQLIGIAPHKRLETKKLLKL